MRMIVFSLLPNRLTPQQAWRWTSVFCAYFITNILIWNISAHATTVCAGYASARSEELPIGAGWNEPTQKLVVFYSALLAEGKLDEADLLKMRNELVRGELVNPFPRIGSTAIQNQQFKRQIASLLNPKVNTAHVLLWVESEMRARGRENVKRDVRKKETRIPFREMQLFRVEPDEFEMGEGTNKKSVVLTHPYEAMSTAVTQWMWVREFGENPARFKVGDQAVEIEIYGNRIQLQPDHPVENVTWWSVVEYANRVTKRMGLTPAYDLSKIKFDPNTSAAKGTYKPLDGQTITNEMLVNHPSHNIYETEGMRLPTKAEWEFLVRDRGRSSTAWHSGDNEMDLKKVAWYSDNANQKTHPVAQLDPLMVDGKPFYDLHGNVWEWIWDWNCEISKGETGPVPPLAVSRRVLRGGSWNYPALYCRSACGYSGTPECGFDGVGARLGRTVR